MWPVLEYGSSVWWPSGKKREKVQNFAARFVTGIYDFETGSMTGILVKWDLLRKGGKIVDLHVYRYTKV